MLLQLAELAAEHQMATNQLKVAHLEEIQELRNKHDLQMEGQASFVLFPLLSRHTYFTAAPDSLSHLSVLCVLCVCVCVCVCA